MFDRVIIADDETAHLEGMKIIVSQICPGTEVLTAKNGLEALELLRQKPTDLIMCDIRMPVMDGIELLKKASAEFPQTKFVMISAYKDFEYAKKAIEYQAVEYIVKPFRVSSLRETLYKVAREKEEEKARELILSDYYRLSEVLKKQEDSRLLQSLLEGRLSEEEKNKLRYADRLRSYGIVVCLYWEALGNRNADISQETLEALIGRINTKSILAYNANRLNEAVLLIPKQSPDAVQHALDDFIAEVREDLKLELYAGISLKVSRLLEMAPEAYSQAYEALSYRFYYSQGRTFLYERLCDSLELTLPSLSRFEQQIRDAVHKCNSEAVYNEIRKMKEQLMQEPPFYPGKVKNRVSSLVVSVINDFEGSVLNREFEELQNSAYLKYSRCKSFEELFSISQELLMSCIRMKGEISKVQNADLIDSCIDYIKQNLNKELSLNELAGRFHFNPNYLSALIKKRTGLSYSAYLLSLRIQTACSLLSKTNDRIKDISLRVGFGDCSYFNRVFRREIGMSPQQYRRKYKRW